MHAIAVEIETLRAAAAVEEYWLAGGSNKRRMKVWVALLNGKSCIIAF